MSKRLFKEYSNKRKWYVISIICFIIIICSSTLFLGNYMATKGIFLFKTSDTVKNTAVQKNNVDKYSSL